MQKITRILVLAALAACALATPAGAVVQWSRQYKIACSACHAPFPRLNQAGIDFRRNGYKFAQNARPSTRATDFIGPTWSPSVKVDDSGDVSNSLKGIKVHLGGAISRQIGALIQPTPGEAADFNMAQVLVVGGNAKMAYRLTAGRLFAWGNGGSVGAGDRFATATMPRMLASLNGVAVGGIGQGFRLDLSHGAGETLSLFSTDLKATTASAPTWGLSFTRRFDPHRNGHAEVFIARSAVPVAAQSRVDAQRYGVFASRGNLLAGGLYGTQRRAVAPGAGTHFATGFLEADWVTGDRHSLLLRGDIERDVVPGRTRTALTLGATAQLSSQSRLDLDFGVKRLYTSAPRTLVRLRFVY